MLQAEVQSTEVHNGDSIGLVVKVFPRDLCHHVSPSQAWKFARYSVYWWLLQFVLDVDGKYRMAHESP